MTFLSFFVCTLCWFYTVYGRHIFHSVMKNHDILIAYENDVVPASRTDRAFIYPSVAICSAEQMDSGRRLMNM